MQQRKTSNQPRRYRNLFALIGVSMALMALGGCETGNRAAYMQHRQVVVDPLNEEQIAALDARDDFAVAVAYAATDTINRD